ncbi:hypothetical protein RHMOL_Rhmol01G0339200 [Rhododendron molle]|uniref:Uncharacterized protein n=1 Tax=Rhododendron molle TaxID=49168 RepID=A0ACC0Q894_RHOML|nr:hypothetical protein RHMOL_Rhmol01G0339200 [Rhododendron molle]
MGRQLERLGRLPELSWSTENPAVVLAIIAALIAVAGMKFQNASENPFHSRPATMTFIVIALLIYGFAAAQTRPIILDGKQQQILMWRIICYYCRLLNSLVLISKVVCQACIVSLFIPFHMDPDGMWHQQHTGSHSGHFKAEQSQRKHTCEHGVPSYQTDHSTQANGKTANTGATQFRRISSSPAHIKEPSQKHTQIQMRSPFNPQTHWRQPEVANAFVQQYYLIQQQSPGLVHRFYQEESKLGRPEDDGTMSTTTTLQAINEKILSLNCGQYRAEITHVDAQESYNGGVHVLVIGYFEGKDNMIIRNFTQTFFLAPQEKGYFVLNDVFRYIEDVNHLGGNQSSTTDVGAPLSPKQDQFPVLEIHVAEETKVTVELNREEAPNPSHNGELSGWEEDNEEVSVVEEDYKEVSVVEEVSVPEVIDKVPDESQLVVESQSRIEVPKKSYAAIVMNMKESDVLLSPSPPPQQSVAKSQEQLQVNIVQASASVAETPVSGPDAIVDGEDQEEEADGYSVYVKNLPYEITPALLEDEFKRFGAIKSGGIQVRSNQASPLSIGGRRAVVEEKRSTCSRGKSSFIMQLHYFKFEGKSEYGIPPFFFWHYVNVNGYRGRYPTSRAYESRQDGNYGNVRGNTRGDFGRTQHGGFRGGYRGGFSSRGGYQRADNMASNDGRMNRGGGMASNGTAKTAAPQVSASA